jgi:ankyrin repeat protein
MEEFMQDVMRALEAENWTQFDSLFKRRQLEATYSDPDTGLTPLHLAVQAGYTALVEHLLKNGANPNAPARFLRLRPPPPAEDEEPEPDDEDEPIDATPLHLAVQRSLELAELLVKHGADVNAKDANESTPILWALGGGPTSNLEMLAFLVKKGADVNSADVWLNTPLHRASSNENPKAIRFLLEHGAKATNQNLNGKVPADMGKAASKAAFEEYKAWMAQRVEDKVNTDRVFEARAKEGKSAPEDLQRMVKSYQGGRKKTRARKPKRRVTRRRK